MARRVTDMNPQAAGELGWLFVDDLAPWMAGPVAHAARPCERGDRDVPSAATCCSSSSARSFAPVTFEEAEEALTAELSQQKMDKEYLDWLETLRKQTFVSRKGLYAEGRRQQAEGGAQRAADELGAGDAHGIPHRPPGRDPRPGAPGSHDEIVVRGARTHNLREHRRHHPARPAGGHHRAVGLRQVEPRVRHPLRRGPAPLRGVAVRLCAAVPRPAREARRRLRRGALARALHRAAQHRQEARAARWARPPRSPTTCGCSSRARASPSATSAACPSRTDRRPDDGARDGAARGSARANPGAHRARASGHVQEGARRPSPQGLRARPHRRRDARRSTRRSSSRAASVTTSRWWWIASWCARSRARGSPTRSRPRCAWSDGLVVVLADRTGGEEPDARGVAALERERVRGLRDLVPELAPRMFSFNSPAGACPACDGLGVQRTLRSRPRRPRPAAPARGRSSPGRQAHTRYYAQLISPTWPRTSASTPTRHGSELPRRSTRRADHSRGTGEEIEIEFSVGLRPTRSGRARKTRVGRALEGRPRRSGAPRRHAARPLPDAASPAPSAREHATARGGAARHASAARRSTS